MRVLTPHIRIPSPGLQHWGDKPPEHSALKASRPALRASWWFSGKESACLFKRHGFNPWVRRSPGEGNGNPLQYSCLGNPMNRRAWQATVRGVARVRHNLAAQHKAGTADASQDWEIETSLSKGTRKISHTPGSHTLQRVSDRLDNTEECISELENSSGHCCCPEKRKKNKDSLRHLWTTLNTLIFAL